MTLIVTQISKHGILHASDSNLTSNNPYSQQQSTGTKCFRIDKLSAGLTIAGSYGVGNQPMDSWLPDFIHNSTACNLEDFAESLRVSLETEMNGDQKKTPNLIHIAGYVESEGKYHPEFWFVRNAYGIDLQTGYYNDVRSEFIKSEDFWNRDNFKNDLNENLFRLFQHDAGLYKIYFNGNPAGRMNFHRIHRHLFEFYRQVWANKTWGFRPPNNIIESKKLLKNNMEIINSIFELSDSLMKPIGGPIQIEMIPQPLEIEI